MSAPPVKHTRMHYTNMNSGSNLTNIFTVVASCR